MKILYKLLPIVLALNLTISFSCNTTEPTPPSNGTLTLSQVDISCTEAWVNLKTNGVTFPVNVNFIADGSTIAQVNNLHSNDTTVYIDSLLPNKTYNIQAIIQSTNQYQATNSNKLSVQTLDTTSNNITWQTYTFGASNAGSSTLFDVAVINDNDIWAVGEIYMDDSTGNPDPLRYNSAHWDGNGWTVFRIPYMYQGQPYYNPIQTVFAFGANDIWFAGNGVLHWDGSQYVPIPLPTNVWGQDQINKIWGSSSQDLYIVGNSGSIAYYNGSTWQKIESGTTTNINDIWGINNSTDSGSFVLATVSSRYEQGDYKLLSITLTNTNEYTNWPYQRLYGIWFYSKRNIFVVSNSAYEYKNDNWSTISLPTNYFLTRVKGNGLNDIYMVGTSGIVFHFNGINWQNVNQISGDYEGLDTKGNTVVAVGFNTAGNVIADAVITIGKR